MAEKSGSEELEIIDDAIGYLNNMKKAYLTGEITERELTAFVFELGESLCGVEPGDDRPASVLFQQLYVTHQNTKKIIDALYERVDAEDKMA